MIRIGWIRNAGWGCAKAQVGYTEAMYINQLKQQLQARYGTSGSMQKQAQDGQQKQASTANTSSQNMIWSPPLSRGDSTQPYDKWYSGILGGLGGFRTGESKYGKWLPPQWQPAEGAKYSHTGGEGWKENPEYRKPNLQQPRPFGLKEDPNDPALYPFIRDENYKPPTVSSASQPAAQPAGTMTQEQFMQQMLELWKKYQQGQSPTTQPTSQTQAPPSTPGMTYEQWRENIQDILSRSQAPRSIDPRWIYA